MVSPNAASRSSVHPRFTKAMLIGAAIGLVVAGSTVAMLGGSISMPWVGVGADHDEDGKITLEEARLEYLSMPKVRFGVWKLSMTIDGKAESVFGSDKNGNYEINRDNYDVSISNIIFHAVVLMNRENGTGFEECIFNDFSLSDGKIDLDLECKSTHWKSKQRGITYLKVRGSYEQKDVSLSGEANYVHGENTESDKFSIDGLWIKD